MRSRVPAGALSTLLTSFAVQASLLITGVVMARDLGPGDRGHFSVFALMGPVASSVLTAGLPLAVTTYLASEPAAARTLVRRLAWPVLCQVAFAMGVGGVVVLLYVVEGDDRLWVTALITVLSVPGWMAWAYGMALAHSLPGLRLFNAARLMQALLFVVLVLAVNFVGDWGLIGFAVAYGLTFGASGVGVLIAALSSLPPSSNTPVTTVGRMLRFGLRALPGSLSPVDLLRVDQVIVAAFVTPAALGLYAAAQSIASVPRVIAQSIGIVAFPRVSRVASEGGDIGREVRTFLGWGMLLVGPAAALLAIVASFVVPRLFGQDFDGAVAPARFLLLGSVFLGLRRIVGDCARALGQGILDSIAEAILWVVLLPTMVVLAQSNGAEGAAVALAISTGVTAAALVVMFALRGRRLLDGERAGLQSTLAPD